jgi:1-deoxy-D-xylulose-5-phosphate reductoisomerase
LKKKIAILGSTGSIGVQALEVISLHPDKFEVEVLTANENADLLIRQAKQYQPNAVVIGNKELYPKVLDILDLLNIKVYAGEDALSQIVDSDSIDIVLVALVGFSGLKPTLKAIEAKKTIALANKESLVVAGELVTKKVMEHHINLIPVDSEHSAIFQCLSGENPDTIEKIILTASGGPFRGASHKFLASAKKAEALAHPNWDMGDKITIDSASLMNKGLEVIEAKWLFGLELNQIEVIIHPQSIIHSMVQFIDGTMKAQMSLPDMRQPIQYAFAFPERIENDYPRFSFADFPQLTFEQADIKKFRNLALAFEALEMGGNVPCILNAANEVVVEAFLQEKTGFLEMPVVIEKCMHSIDFVKSPSLDDYILSDRETRKFAASLL